MPTMGLVELSEQVILESMDRKKTYYNSILSNIKPKFRSKISRKNGNNLDEDENSIREDPSGFASFSKNSALVNK